MELFMLLSGLYFKWIMELNVGFTGYVIMALFLKQTVPRYASSWVVRTFRISFTQVVFTSALGA
jgi:hypothetical protein